LPGRPYEGPDKRPHMRFDLFVFADNDVFSDPSWSLFFLLGEEGSRIDPSIHDVRFAAAGWAGTET